MLAFNGKINNELDGLTYADRWCVPWKETWQPTDSGRVGLFIARALVMSHIAAPAKCGY